MTQDIHSLFPDDLSDETAAALSDFLYALAFACESRYLCKLLRFSDRRSEPRDPDQPWKQARDKPGG